MYGWRRLIPDRIAFSGQMETSELPPWYNKNNGTYRKRKRIYSFYVSYIEFDVILYYDTLVGYWDEHYLGEKDGKCYTLFLFDQSRTDGPRLKL